MLFGSPILPILRAQNAEDLLQQIGGVCDLGHSACEVLRTDSNTWEWVATAKSRFPELKIGIGTCWSTTHLDEARAARADFCVSPGLSSELVEYAKQLKIDYIPGCATPTDWQHARALNLDWIKFFPAAVLGADHLKAMLAVFPQFKVLATGGMTATNYQSFLSAGARMAGISRDLPPLEDLS